MKPLYPLLLGLALSACSSPADQSPAGKPAASAAADPTAASIAILPESAMVRLGDRQRFSIVVKDTDGKSMAAEPGSLDATGGWISPAGDFTAGPDVGRYRVTARTANGLEASAIVEIVTDVVEIRPCGPDVGDSGACGPQNQYIQEAVDAHPAGTGFLLKAGVHRFNRVQPRDGNVFVGEAGTLMTGALTLTDFTRDPATGLWTHGGLTMQGQRHGLCDGALQNADGTRYSGCRYPEDLFVDDVAQFQVETLAEVDAGEVDGLFGTVMNKWFFDYDNDRIYFYLPGDPSEHEVEISVTRSAFAGDAKDVTIRNVVFEKYANPAQMGVVGDQNPGDGWIVEDSEVRLGHGRGITVRNGGAIRRSHVHHMGHQGLGGTGPDIEITDNELAYNNTLRFAWGWEAGGAKFSKTENLRVVNNYSHHNGGPGLWTDGENMHVVYDGNTVDCNRRLGIFHEISYDAVIRNNTVRLNGLDGHLENDWLYGAQILSAHSPNVEIHHNRVEVHAEAGDGIGLIEQDRGEGANGAFKALNNYVHHNEITYFGDFGQSGAAADYPDGTATIWAGSNLFDSNVYHAPRILDQSRWTWRGNRDWQGLLAEGQESNGTADTNVPDEPTVACGPEG